MQKRKLGNGHLEVPAIRLRPASARQVSAFSHGCMSIFQIRNSELKPAIIAARRVTKRNGSFPAAE